MGRELAKCRLDVFVQEIKWDKKGTVRAEDWKNEMGWKCGTYEDQESCIVFWWGDMGERDHLEDPSVDGFLRSGMGRHGLDHCGLG